PQLYNGLWEAQASEVKASKALLALMPTPAADAVADGPAAAEPVATPMDEAELTAVADEVLVLPQLSLEARLARAVKHVAKKKRGPKQAVLATSDEYEYVSEAVARDEADRIAEEEALAKAEQKLQDAAAKAAKKVADAEAKEATKAKAALDKLRLPVTFVPTEPTPVFDAFLIKYAGVKSVLLRRNGKLVNYFLLGKRQKPDADEAADED